MTECRILLMLLDGPRWDLAGLIAHNDHGVQYLSVAYSEHLATAGIKPSTGAVGSSCDNALAESVIGSRGLLSNGAKTAAEATSIAD